MGVFPQHLQQPLCAAGGQTFSQEGDSILAFRPSVKHTHTSPKVITSQVISKRGCEGSVTSQQTL